MDPEILKVLIDVRIQNISTDINNRTDKAILLWLQKWIDDEKN